MATPLSKMLALYFAATNADQDATANKIGIHPSSLSRLKAGKLTDAQGIAKLLVWMLSPEDGST